MKNILLKISYDGTEFCGWQRQPKDRTVQGELEGSLSQLFGEPMQVSGTSRTDAGVHAHGQQANFLVETPIPLERMKMVINNRLPADIRIREAVEVPSDFHARFSCKGKKYIYKVMNTEEVDVFDRNYSYHVSHTLNTDQMTEAARWMEGRHDFKSFMAMGSNVPESTERTIYSLKLISDPSKHCMEIHVIGDGFLYNMVRIIAGTLIDVGTGRMKPDHVKAIIEAKDRSKAGHTAPPQGLYLSEIYFDERDLPGKEKK